MPTLCFIIHGIGEQTPAFSDPLQRGVHRELQDLVELAEKDPEKRKSVDVTKLVKFIPISWGDIGYSDQGTLYRTLYPDSFSMKGKFRQLWNAVMRFQPARQLSIYLIGDVFKYVGRYGIEIRRAVFKRIQAEVQQVVKDGEPISIILVGHSLGTVILLDIIDGLKQSSAEFDASLADISLFTMGSPRALFSLMTKRAKPANFRKWMNFLHDRDPIAFPMHALDEHVEDVHLKQWTLHPLRPWNPLYLHSAYWKHPVVHRHIAHEISVHHEKGLVKLRSDFTQEPTPDIFGPPSGAAAIAGLIEYYTNFETIPFEEFLARAKHIDICYMYGGHWIKGKAKALAQSLRNPEVSVRVCVLAPDSPSLGGVAYHYSDMSEEGLRANIEAGCEELLSALEDAQKHATITGRLQIFRARNVINHSMYRFDNVVCWVPRPFASAKLASMPLPGCLCRDAGPESLFSWFAKDFEAALDNQHDATIYFDSATT